MQPPQATLKNTLGFELPPFVIDPKVEVERGMGLFVYLRCEIPATKEQAFLQSSALLPGTVTDTKSPIEWSAYNQKSAWWRPAELNAPTYGSKRGQRGKWRTEGHLAIDRRGDRAVIYFLYIEEA